MSRRDVLIGKLADTMGSDNARALLDDVIHESRERDDLLAALKVIHTTVRGDEKNECWTIRKWLAERQVFNDDIQGQRRLVEAACLFAISKAEGRT